MGRGLDFNISWVGGEGAWFVGVNLGAETIFVSDVLDDTGDTGGISKGVLAGDDTLFVGGFLTTQFGAEFVFGIESESVWSWSFTFDRGRDVGWLDGTGNLDWLGDEGWSNNSDGLWLNGNNLGWTGQENTSGATSAKLDDLLGASG